MAKCFSLQSTHPWRNILEKKAVVSIAKIIVYNPKDLHKLYSELYFNAEIVHTIYSGNKKKLLFCFYIFEKMMWHIVFHSKAHTHVGLFWKKRLWLVIQKENNTILKTCTIFITSCISMQRSYVQYIFWKQKETPFLFYIFEKMMWQIVSHSKTHTHVGLFWKKRLWLILQRKKVYNS